MFMKTFVLTTLLFLLSAVTIAAAAADVIWQEAEQFKSVGKWPNEPQHTDIMGSPYLPATGVGKPPDKRNITGNTAELFPEQGFTNYADPVKMGRIVYAEENNSLFLNTRVFDVEMDSKSRIKAVIGQFLVFCREARYAQICIRFMSATFNVGTGPSSVTAC